MTNCLWIDLLLLGEPHLSEGEVGEGLPFTLKCKKEPLPEDHLAADICLPLGVGGGHDRPMADTPLRNLKNSTVEGNGVAPHVGE